jgi:hypothetical protein
VVEKNEIHYHYHHASKGSLKEDLSPIDEIQMAKPLKYKGSGVGEFKGPKSKPMNLKLDDIDPEEQEEKTSKESRKVNDDSMANILPPPKPKAIPVSTPSGTTSRRNISEIFKLAQLKQSSDEKKPQKAVSIQESNDLSSK